MQRSGIGGAGGAGGSRWTFAPGVNIQQQKDPMDQELEDKKIRIRVQQLDIAKARHVIQKVLKTSIVPFLWGPPGVGKSTVVREIAEENKWELVDLRASLLSPVDFRGLPVINKDTKEADWYPPSFLPRFDTKKTGILFLDELNLAPPSTQAAAYQLILDKRVGEYRFPSHWKIVAAGNRETDKANVYRMPAPLANRFVHFDITAHINSWRDWARQNHVLPEIMDFLTLRPSFLLQMPTNEDKAFPSPRSWAFTSELLQAFDYHENNGELGEDLKQMVVGTLGKGVGSEFLGFIENYKLQALSKQVEEFIRTGKIQMPQAPSLRFGLIQAIYDAWISEKVKDDVYQTWYKALSGEERRTLDDYDREQGQALRQRRSGVLPLPNQKMPSTVLIRPVGPNDDTIHVANADILTTGAFLIFNPKNGDVEVCTFKHKGPSTLTGVTRGTGQTTALSWPQGCYVQPI